ncbi:uncharacterized protein LOC122299173 [Carya illinoinensis]|uniref:uncharacterized protein LOC122299173 n=1 Tax=Carya illinoinensis TaxID=32201 RepID=UPI001C71C204|nr:uncharacterized protein LOC122299173 [Carya illinoinensis]
MEDFSQLIFDLELLDLPLMFVFWGGGGGVENIRGLILEVQGWTDSLSLLLGSPIFWRFVKKECAGVIRQHERDQMYWRYTASKKFTVGSYKTLYDQHSISFPWKSIWKARVPSKVAFFCVDSSNWEHLTIDNLRKCGMIVLEWCFMCKKAAESVDHLLIHCDVAKGLWDGVFGRSGLSWVMPNSVVEVLACWPTLLSCSQVAAVRKMTPLCIMWCMWLERNERCFNNREHNVDEIWGLFCMFFV